MVGGEYAIGRKLIPAAQDFYKIFAGKTPKEISGIVKAMVAEGTIGTGLMGSQLQEESPTGLITPEQSSFL